MFKGGVHPKESKSLTENKAIENILNHMKINTVKIPIFQFKNEEVDIVVSVGDEVKKGQVIATRKGLYGVNVHASCSGKVTNFVDMKNPQGIVEKYIEIENNHLEVTSKMEHVGNIDKETLIEKLKEAGIVGMGGAGFPTHVKLDTPKDVVVDTLILNGAECEPYITCDHRLMVEKSIEIIEGAKIIAKALGLTKIIVGVEDNKEDAIEKLLSVSGTSKYKKDIANKIIISEIKTKYPQGAERMLVQSTTGKRIQTKQLPYDVGCIIINIHTAYSIYQAISNDIPLVERVVTISGNGVEKAGNYSIPVGTSVEEIAKALNYSEEKTRAVVLGGTMMGTAIYDLSTVVTKTTSSILFLSEEEVSTSLSSSCINCGKCAAACPIGLMPMYIDIYTLDGNLEGAKKYGALDCMECGCCSYVCPAKRTLVQSIKLAKKIIKTRGV